MLDERVRQLVEEVRQYAQQSALIDAAAFWDRLALTDASPTERANCLSALQALHLKVKEYPAQGKVYLLWDGPVTTAQKRKRQKVQAEQAAQAQARAAAREQLPPYHLDLAGDQVRAVSVRQPFVELILSGRKTVEHRSWPIAPGPLVLHASNTITAEEREVAEAAGLDLGGLPRGQLLGVVEVVRVQNGSGSLDWVLAHPRRFRQPVAMKGAVGILRARLDPLREELQEWRSEIRS